MFVLLVEDEALIREIMAESLADAGYGVIEAGTGDEAIALIRGHAHEFGIVVTDFHMPGAATGADVAACLGVEYPGIPVVIVSGRPDVFRVGWQSRLGYGLLRKPYVARDLVAIIRRMTEPAQPS